MRADLNDRIRIRRAYEPASAEDGRRFLVERLWPRGVSKQALRVEAWLEDVAPSDALRRWYGHRPERWPEFRRRYLQELSGCGDAAAPLLEAAAEGPVTLVFAARDSERSGAAVLAAWLRRRLTPGRRRASPRTPPARRRG